MQGELCWLFRSPGHDFKGHHGMPRGNHGSEACETIEVVAGHGIVGDRFFAHREDFGGQITFLAMEVVDALRVRFALPGLEPEVLRRNVVTRGVPLSDLVGQRFTLQGVVFEGTEECSPCYWMDQAVAPGAEVFLTGQGGLRARILTSGTLHLGAAAFLRQT